MSVQVTNRDIVLFGHGSYEGGAINTKLPENIELHILQPVGYSLRGDVALALIRQNQITKLTLHHVGGDTSPFLPPSAIYRGGDLAPNLTLYDLGSDSELGKKIIGDKKNVVTVNKTTSLSELIQSNKKINEALKHLSEGEKLKLYWSACADQVFGNFASLDREKL